MKIYIKNRIRRLKAKLTQNIRRIKMIIKSFFKRKGPYVY